MAKDGSHRGGARPGAGRKKKPLAEKLAEGKSTKVMMAQPAITLMSAVGGYRPRRLDRLDRLIRETKNR